MAHRRDASLCMVAPHPDLADQLRQQFEALRVSTNTALGGLLTLGQPRRLGFNDGTIIEPEDFGLEASVSAVRRAAAERAPLRGAIRVMVVLVDFADRQMAATKQHFQDLFFSQQVFPFGSVSEYYQEASGGRISITGAVVGPYRLPLTLAQYANGESGTGGVVPNAQTMARHALDAASQDVNFATYDNDGNGYVDAFIVIHAGRGAEETNNGSEIWSHKWTLDGGAVTRNGKKIFAYLTVPEDSRIGVCAHELGHLLFGWPDLYDTDYTSNGVGRWCLMAGGSWNGRGVPGAQAGDVPAHPSAWCKAGQEWVAVKAPKQNGSVTIEPVGAAQTVHRLWKNGDKKSREYFLVENRQKSGYDRDLPAAGLLIWHVDDAMPDNSNEAHYKVALMQADNLRDLESARDSGDAGDPYPGTSNNKTFSRTSAPSSRSYSGLPTDVSITAISRVAAGIRARCAVRKAAPASAPGPRLPVRAART